MHYYENLQKADGKSSDKQRMFGHSGKRKSYGAIWDMDREEGVQMKPEVVDKGEISGGGENWKQYRTACGKADRP